LTSDVIALADSFAWSSFHIIGHDWGGFLAWRLAAKFSDRVRSLIVLSTAHVDAFLDAISSDSDQKARSQYIELFKMPGHVAEAMFLKDDGLRLRGVFQGKVPEEQVSINMHRFLEPGALTATLNWYRALDLDARIGPVSRSHALYLGRSRHGAWTHCRRSNKGSREWSLSFRGADRTLALATG
jgi:pimeloyl-ACP methyl ester carboxylesterase